MSEKAENYLNFDPPEDGMEVKLKCARKIDWVDWFLPAGLVVVSVVGIILLVGWVTEPEPAEAFVDYQQVQAEELKKLNKNLSDLVKEVEDFNREYKRANK